MRAALALFLLSACAPTPPVDIASPRALATCQARGGEVGLPYRAPAPICFTPYPDGGRACGDSAQCAGRCIAMEDGPHGRYEFGPGRTVSGQCESYHPTPFEECVIEVRSGRAVQACAPPRPPA